MSALVFMPCCQHLPMGGEFRETQKSMVRKNEAISGDECCANRGAMISAMKSRRRLGWDEGLELENSFFARKRRDSGKRRRKGERRAQRARGSQHGSPKFITPVTVRNRLEK